MSTSGNTTCFLRRAMRMAALPVLLLLAACDGRKSQGGMEWQPPRETDMPYAFSPEETVPQYARLWRMPQGFQGFTQRWNTTVHNYLTDTRAQQAKECMDASLDTLTACPGTDGRKTASIRKRAAWHKFRVLQNRLSEGDYLTYQPEDRLSQTLTWHTGEDEPELGSPAARKGGTMRLTIQRSFPGTFRPFGPNSSNPTRHYIYDDITMQPTRMHPGTGAIIPGTADRWAVDRDGRTVYFHIDENARFSDGSKLTARDFVTALFIRTSDYAQEPFYRDFYLENISHITIYGDNVIAVTLPSARPNAAFYANIPSSCTRFYAEFGPDYVTRYLWRIPPTTGGYVLDPGGVIMGRQLTLKRVENWWAKDRRYTRHSCNVDRIVYSFIADSAKAKELFRMGELDVLPARDVDVWYEGLEIDPVHRGLIQRVQFSNIWPRNSQGLHLNCSCPPLDDKDVRMGIQHAINIQGVINTVFRGDCVRLGSYFSGFGDYTDKTITAPEYDPTKAREYFALAGYTETGGDGILCKPDGERLQVTVSCRIDPLYANCMSLLREDAARCGLDLRVEQLEGSVFNSKVLNKQYMAAMWAWVLSPPAPDASQFFLSRYAFQSDGTLAKGTANVTCTASPALDEAILHAQTARTLEEATAANHQVQRLIADTAAWVPGWTTNFHRFAQWRWVRWPEGGGYPFCPPGYSDPLDSYLYWIDPEIQQKTLRSRAGGDAVPEKELIIGLPGQQKPQQAKKKRK